MDVFAEASSIIRQYGSVHLHAGEVLFLFYSIRILYISCCSRRRWIVVMNWKGQHRPAMVEKFGAEATPHRIVVKGWWDLSFTWSERSWRRRWTGSFSD